MVYFAETDAQYHDTHICQTVKTCGQLQHIHSNKDRNGTILTHL